MPIEQQWAVFKVAACYVSGFLFTNMAFRMLAASTVETIKTAQTVRVCAIDAVAIYRECVVFVRFRHHRDPFVYPDKTLVVTIAHAGNKYAHIHSFMCQ